MKLDRSRIYRYASIDSTMTLAASFDQGAVVVADEQTAGLGRHGHNWHSEAGSGLYVSVVLNPAPLLTLSLGLATQAAISEATGIQCDLRWPNDLMIGGRKTAGILVQMAEGNAIAGLGINVNHTAFPADLEPYATSLRLHAGKAFARAEILNALLNSIETFTDEAPETILRLFAHSSSYASGRRVTVAVPDGTIEGTTAGLTADGFLVVRHDDGTDTIVIAGGVRAAGS
jgi:BirA family biotin operon repressor/biotin-[acetyl-CoA-carboxylase] ligase